MIFRFHIFLEVTLVTTSYVFDFPDYHEAKQIRLILVVF